LGEHVISTAVSAVRDNIRDIYFVGRDALKFSPTLLRFLACCFVRGGWSSLGPPNVITLLSQKRIGNYSAKLIAKTITGRAAGGVITTPQRDSRLKDIFATAMGKSAILVATVASPLNVEYSYTDIRSTCGSSFAFDFSCDACFQGWRSHTCLCGCAPALGAQLRTGLASQPRLFSGSGENKDPSRTKIPARDDSRNPDVRENFRRGEA